MTRCRIRCRIREHSGYEQNWELKTSRGKGGGGGGKGSGGGKGGRGGKGGGGGGGGARFY